MSQAIYLNDWKDGTEIDVFTDFSGSRWSAYRDDDAVPVQDKPEYQGVEILFASYSYENYSGDAFVLFRKYGQLYEVNGGHCSCYGLEGQWEPEETSVEALRQRLANGMGKKDYCGNEYSEELARFLDEIDNI